MKKLSDISWKVSEEEYRNDSALSYSMLAKFARDGFNAVATLKEKQESPSLTFGSVVDTLITSPEEFNDKYVVMTLPAISDTLKEIVNDLYSKYKDEYETIAQMNDDIISEVGLAHDYYKADKYRNHRIKTIRECDNYYKTLQSVGDKTVIDTDTYMDALKCVQALKEDDTTKWYFAENTPFDTNISRDYQLKFKTKLTNLEYRCMADLLIVDYDKKEIIPVDLKTSSSNEWDFTKTFVKWQYQIQARLYWRIIRQCMDHDEFFKDFKLCDYRFIVINRNNLVPLVWEFNMSATPGLLVFGEHYDIKFVDPEILGEELNEYMTSEYRAPKDINFVEPNSLTTKLMEL